LYVKWDLPWRRIPFFMSATFPSQESTSREGTGAVPGPRPALLLLALVLGVFLAVTLPELPTAAVKSDATLSLYAAQQVAAGRPPYADYIIMHPPVPHLLGAAALRVGRLFQVSDALSMKALCLALALASLLVVYRLAGEFQRGLGPLAAAAASWTQLMLMVAWGMEVKLAMLLFYTAMLLNLARRRWLAAGVFLGLAVLSWSGGVFFAGIALLVLLLSRTDWKRGAARLLAGFGSVAAALAALLAAAGTLDNFARQYGLTFIQYAANKLAGEGVRDPAAGLANILQSGELSPVDLLILFAGLGGLLVYAARAPRRAFRTGPSAVLALSLLIPAAMALADYQSPFDMLPLLPGAAVLGAWLASDAMRGWVRLWKVPYDPAYPAALIAMLSLLRLPGLSSLPDRLPAQTAAARWVADSGAGAYSIQAIGDLSILVLGNQRNALPVIHAGPKTYLAMENLGWPVERVVEALDQARPGIILIDVRNANQSYLSPLLDFLAREYLYLGDTAEPTAHIYAAPGRPEAVRDAVGFLLIHRGAPESAGQPPAVSLEQLAALQELEASRLDEFHVLLAHTVETDLSLYWWSQPYTPMEGQVALRWLARSGQPAGGWHVEGVDWLPGYPSLSRHALPGGRPPEGSLEVCILQLGSDPEHPVCLGQSAILDLTAPGN
jgi:hypothetical protein